LVLLFPWVQSALADGDLGAEQAAEKNELEQMKHELNNVKSITNDAIQGLNKINLDALNQVTKEFHLICKEATVEIMPGVSVSCLTYNGRLPGPLIRLKQGEQARIVLHNQMRVATSLHFQGMCLPANVDGLPRHEGGLVRPGETYVYQFTTPAPGLYFYQPQIPHAEQKTRGMCGAIVVDSRGPGGAGNVDKEFVLVVSDLYAIAGDAVMPKKLADKSVVTVPPSMPDAHKRLIAVSPVKYQASVKEKQVFYLLNGQCAPAIPPLEVSNGMRVKLQLINSGQTLVPLHLSGHRFEIGSAYGGNESSQSGLDTVALAPGASLSVAFTANNPGVWSLASEVFEQSTNLGTFPGGIACVVRYVDSSSH
jgi:FtsP/CotA-like multicopper oxidase with cupredoxin domain